MGSRYLLPKNFFGYININLQLKINKKQKKYINQVSKYLLMPGTNLKTIKLTISYLKQTKIFFIKIKESSTNINRSGSRTFMTSKKEFSVAISNHYKPVNSRWGPKSPGLILDNILLLSDELLLKGEDRQKNPIHKSISSNLLVDKRKSFVKLVIFVFSFALKVVLPNSKTCASEKPVLSYSVWSMLTKLLRGVRRSWLYKGQWRKKMNSRFYIITAVTYRIESILKAVLEFMLSQMTQSKSKSCNTFDSDRISAIEKRIRRRSCEF